MLQSLSYGANNPSIDMQRRMALIGREQLRINARRDFSLVAELTLESVHIGNLGELPPSPDMILFRARQTGLITVVEASRISLYL